MRQVGMQFVICRDMIAPRLAQRLATNAAAGRRLAWRWPWRMDRNNVARPSRYFVRGQQRIGMVGTGWAYVLGCVPLVLLFIACGLHSNPNHSGQKLGSGWYERRVPDAGSDVVWLQKGPLSGDNAAFDIVVPLRAGGRTIGEYHVGLDGQWFEETVAQEQRSVAA